jgi:hypothetical protein
MKKITSPPKETPPKLSSTQAENIMHNVFSGGKIFVKPGDDPSALKGPRGSWSDEFTEEEQTKWFMKSHEPAS